MFVPSSVLAAMTIAGAFWVGVLAARRLRQWGDSQRSVDGHDESSSALEAGDHDGDREAIEEKKESSPVRSRFLGKSSDASRAANHGAGSGSRERAADGGHALTHSSAAMRVREALAHKIEAELATGGLVAQKRQLLNRAADEELGLQRARVRDVVSRDDLFSRDHAAGSASNDASERGVAIDYLVEGIVHLREGTTTTRILVVSDAGHQRWLVGVSGEAQWLWLEPVTRHGLQGEPPRQILRPDGRTYSLERRAQHSVALTGVHGRPDLPRMGSYLYRAVDRSVLWVERWGDQVLMGQGQSVPRHEFSFLPGPG